jgi:tRNA1Val (adenine37-N6)-methyltransferase
MTEPFRFKKFTIEHDRCAMKIGTDSVLLGAWVDLNFKPISILDIGAGSGIIAVQLAQKCDADTIDAVEIDIDAFEQCVDNFENSPWGDRLFCYHASAQEFADEIEEPYDLIVSNPPFFKEDYKTDIPSRDLARFSDALPFGHLIEVVNKLLSNIGRFALILPRKEENKFIQLASEKELFPLRICRISGSKNSMEIRSMIEFTRQKSTPQIEQLCIEISRHEYTPEYKKLVKDFYLNM